jgi:hypothetical protein
MKDTNFLEAVTERDMDLLILEELHASAVFRSWLVASTYGGEPEAVLFAGAWHSLTHPSLGESDLVFRFGPHPGEMRAVLIENKIDALPQPEQCCRYRARGEAGIEAGHWVAFKTCIVAPQLYLSKVSDAVGYDVALSYESLLDWFRANRSDPERSRYKAHLINEAIQKNRRGYNPKRDERVSQFWHAYWNQAHLEFPELEMKEPGAKPAQSTWIEFRPKNLGGSRRIIHKLPNGIVDLQMDGAAHSVAGLASIHRDTLGSGVEIVQSGKSASVRICVPIIDLYGDYGEQMSKVRAGLRAAFRLLILSPTIKMP